MNTLCWGLPSHPKASPRRFQEFLEATFWGEKWGTWNGKYNSIQIQIHSTFIQYTIYFTTHDLALVGWWTAFWKKIHWRMEVWWRACADSCTFSGQNSGARIAPLATYLGQLQGSLTRYHKISIDIIYYWVNFSVAIMHWCYVKLLLTVNHFVDDFPLHSLFISVNLIVGFDSFLSRSTAETPRTWRRSIQMSFRQGRKFYLLGTIASSSHVIISPSENHHQFCRI